jgi:hypothetical protein
LSIGGRQQRISGPESTEKQTSRSNRGTTSATTLHGTGVSAKA